MSNQRETRRALFWTMLSFYINETDIVQSTTSSLGFITRAPSMIIKKGPLFPSIPFVRFRHAFLLLLLRSSLKEIRGSHSPRPTPLSRGDVRLHRRRLWRRRRERVRLLRFNRVTSHFPSPSPTAPSTTILLGHQGVVVIFHC